ncbi:MAG: single-stranded-DNA-specific exonuclease RecJ [Acidobacteria bacterium]|nr:single-stranded-DNA-specific exonuclease RecJ [Acidobacteriota bacterium]
MRWVLPEIDHESTQKLSQQLGVSPLLARLLTLRGLGKPEAAHRFLHPSLDHLHDPARMLGMEAAVRRILQAIEHKEKILIYGDYDVDGAMAVVILHSTLSLLGAEVHNYIPHRFRDGYGMRTEVMEQARQQGFAVIISVDTGIRAHAVVERARELNLDCIITDHHLPAAPGEEDGGIPRALAVLNPKQPNCPYPDKNLCGAGVAFKLAQALLQSRLADAARLARIISSLLKIVCIGTIADIVPLVGENRVIARLGLDGLRLPVNPGLKALIQTAGLDGKTITAGDVGFRLAPRINAAGRMESAEEVIEMFTVAGPERAQQVALKLNRLNSERQNAEKEILSEIDERHRQQPESFTDTFLVLAGEGWHRGVVGIVASRMVDRFHRPALVISCESGTGHGSGRSIEKFHLLDALTACGDLFDRFGGHASAAGFALPVGRIEELRRRLNEYAAARLGPDELEPEMNVDAEIRFEDISPEMVEELERLAPHGYGNPRPVFSTRDAQVSGRPRLLQDKHLKMQVAQQGRVLDAIGWRKGAWLEKLTNGGSSFSLDLAFRLERNYYMNQERLQLELLDLITRTGS